MPIRYLRDRIIYAGATASVIALGLASRKWTWLFPDALDKYPGEALWGMMAFFGLRALKPRGSIAVAGVLSLCVSWLAEISQLYQAPWINSIRSNALGHLLLGYTFSWYDMIAYATGIGLGAMIAVGIRKRTR